LSGLLHSGFDFKFANKHVLSEILLQNSSDDKVSVADWVQSHFKVFLVQIEVLEVLKQMLRLYDLFKRVLAVDTSLLVCKGEVGWVYDFDFDRVVVTVRLNLISNSMNSMISAAINITDDM